MSHVELRHLSKQFPGVTALDDISFDVKDGEFFVLLGPTGAGKTTTLRVIAGLEHQESGSVLFDGEAVDNLTPSDRDIALVFQQYSLYPTMSVYDNLAFPLRSPLRRKSAEEIRKKVEDTAEKLRISHLLKRKTAHLSGGEMQRVSIGRAIVRSPRVFLMDEPLSNLDAKLREALRIELQHLQKTQGSTTLFVTHDQIEALTMADRIAVLNEGRIIQIGTPEDIYDRPATTFIAQLVGSPRINLYNARREDDTISISDSDVHLPAPRGSKPPSEFLVGIRPENVNPDPKGNFTGQLVLAEPLGVETILHIQSGQRTLLSLVPGITSYHLGDVMKFNIAFEHIHYFGLNGDRLQS
ncbi:MAG: ABC transporter ATP-binding protein [Chloroflexi bacterium]|jgi:multiple sugar transport system ATP-binding protein|nr:ABC transporter ATP-binding protein [Chloroflexota bacterium]